MLLFVTSRYPTEKHPKLPELLPFFRELLPPGPEKQEIGARTGLIFEVLIHPKNGCLAKSCRGDFCSRWEHKYFSRGRRPVPGGPKTGKIICGSS
jgi:hypothetical protein